MCSAPCTANADVYDLDAIRAAHPIVETVCDAGVDLRRSGRRLAGCCPFHEDRDPSFVVYPDTGSYFCFGCNAGGDVIDFVGRLHGTDFKETAALLADNAAVTPRPANIVQFPGRRAARPVADEEAAVVEAAVQHYERTTGRRAARTYLQNRGVNAATAASLRLGYADGDLEGELRRRGLSIEVAQRLGLLSRDRDAFAGRIVIPDLDADGRARWLTGRALGDREPRYLNLRVASPLLGFARIRSVGARAVVVTEGPFDWLTACGWNLHAVALLGTHASNEALAALRVFRRVYLALDADGPGRRAATRVATELGARAVVVPLPRDVHDLNQLGRRRDGREAFLRSLYQARARREGSWQEIDARGRQAHAA